MHWKHSKFQIVSMILNGCHTYDEAYRVLRELEEDRDLSIKLSLAETYRAEAKSLSADLVLKDALEEEYVKLQSKAAKHEVESRSEIFMKVLAAAETELAFIRELIERIQPLRAFKHLDDASAFQAIQPLEFKYDLIWKAYTMICVSGHVSYDHLDAIKRHPQSLTLITAIKELQERLQSEGIHALRLLTKDDVLQLVADAGEHYVSNFSNVLGAQDATNLLRASKSNNRLGQ